MPGLDFCPATGVFLAGLNFGDVGNGLDWSDMAGFFERGSGVAGEPGLPGGDVFCAWSVTWLSKDLIRVWTPGECWSPYRLETPQLCKGNTRYNVIVPKA